jgi:Kef-type K+ transport system membrane component KefB
MPKVLGALIAGIIIGPSVLGIVHSNQQIKFLSDLGVVMLMFGAGVETNLEELKKAGKTSFLIAVGGIILPLILGFCGANLFFNNFWENLFIGVILTATSVSITVQTLTELGKLNTRAGMNIVGAAVIDDILGLVLISFVLVLFQANQGSQSVNILESIGIVSLKVIAFCVISLMSIAFLPKYIDKYINKFGSHEQIGIFAIALALISAFIAEELQIAAITGAYVCGLMLSKLESKEYIEGKVKTISNYFLSPIFFASVGLAVNLENMSAKILFLSLLLLLIAILGKIIGCGLTAKVLRLKSSEAFQIGCGMVSRGEVALITTNIGLSNKIITPNLYVPTLIIVVATTVVTPIFLKLSFSRKLEKSFDKKLNK